MSLRAMNEPVGDARRCPGRDARLLEGLFPVGFPSAGQWACAHSTSRAISPIPTITRMNLITRSWSRVGMG